MWLAFLLPLAWNNAERAVTSSRYDMSLALRLPNVDIAPLRRRVKFDSIVDRENAAQINQLFDALDRLKNHGFDIYQKRG